MAESGSWHLVRQGEDQPFIVAGDVIVGRSKQADLRIEEGYVSRRHARLWLEAGRLMVEDLGSANGTFLNGERLDARQCLTPGDRICFDETEFYVEAPERSLADPNATAHRPHDDTDPSYRRPERPANWAPAAPASPGFDPNATVDAEGDALDAAAESPFDPGATVPAEEELPPAMAAGGGASDTEFEFDLDNDEFDLPGAASPPPPPPPRPRKPPTPATEPDFNLSLGGDEDFDLDLTGGKDIDLSIGSARPVDGPAPAATVVMAPGETAPPASTPAAGATVVMAPGDAPQPPPAPAASRGETSGLLFLTGPEEGVLYELADGRVSIGRAPECDIRIEESSVSKRHVELLVQPGNCRIHDTSNSNGVFVNGQQVDDVALNPGDVIRLGRIEIMFDAYHKLAEGGAGDDGVPWGLLVGSFLGTVGLAAALYFALQLL